ncbi:type II secretion system F family protein [Neobacillus kokaensis]|uniref:Secretion system protein n=1 Tax=Neobacillus kokaensis TaxID=2759023 RepID=A0ABQ3MXX6_9BACI|nr:type II secretion system F family protein [Neobacillus kokaensis]GHH96696.1 secretion system protein [Neobacillus kokaensis]
MAVLNIFVYFAFAALVFLFFFLFLQLFGSKQSRMDKRLTYYLLEEEKQAIPVEGLEKKQKKERLQIMKWAQKSNNRIKKNLNKRKTNEKVERFLDSAGSSWTAGEYTAFRWIFGGIFSGMLFLLTGQLLFILVGFLIGYMFPRIQLTMKQKKRIRKFNDQLQDMISTIISSMRAGYSFNQALKAVSEESSSPMREEMEQVLKEMQYGISMDDALHHLYDRVPSKDLDIMIQAILIQRQVGGNLATVLSMIVETIRERQKIQAQIKALTAQGRMSGAVIGALPFALGGLIYLMQPSYIKVLFTNAIGIILVVAALGSGILGFWLIQKIIRIEV